MTSLSRIRSAGFLLAAAWLAGVGGLLLEMVWVRRHGLLVGNTAMASANVLALFLVGLGLGGLTLPRAELSRRRPLAAAAVLYAAVAVAAITGESLLRVLPPLGSGVGMTLAVLVPGVPAFLMGGAFPLLFAGVSRGSSGVLLITANLLGSVVATFVGGNFAIPTLGLTRCGWIGVGCYGLAALLVVLPARSVGRAAAGALPSSPPPLPPPGWGEAMAAVSGFLVLGFELFLLRRLPFFLDGFQPTLSGVLATCLLGLTVGSMVGPPLLRRLFGARAAAGSVVLGAGVIALGGHEWLAPALGRLAVGSDAAFHGRILAAAAAAALLPCLILGATVPLCLQQFQHPETRAPLAGRLFFWQGLGSLIGALTVGHLLPWALPATFFRLALPVLAGVAMLSVWGRLRWQAALGLGLVAVLAFAGITDGSLGRRSVAPVAGSRYDRPERYRFLAHRTDSVVTASVVYDRSKHGLILFTDEFRAAYIDADSGYMRVLGHLPFLLRPADALERVAVVALGTGTTANAVQLWPDPKELHVVEISPAVVSLADHFAKDGPARAPMTAPFRGDPRTRIHVTDGRRFVARRPAGSLDLISMEPLLPYAPGTVPLYTREFYRHCADALSDRGLMVQWVPTHSMPEEFFQTLLATFARSFPHHSVWLLNQSTLLVGSATPHLPPIDTLRGRLAEMPGGARADLHGAGIATGEDLIAAFVGDDALRVCAAPDLVDDRPFLERIGYWSAGTRFAFLPRNLAVLKAIADRPDNWPGGRSWRGVRVDRLQGLEDLAIAAATADGTPNALAIMALGRTRAQLPNSVLLFEELGRARRALLEKEVRTGAQTAAAIRRRVPLARLQQHLKRDPGSAFLWAARALLEGTEVEQHRAMRTALALDPTIYARWPEFRLRWVKPAEIDEARGPFEDLAVLPQGASLRRRGVGDDPAAVAFRSRYRLQVAEAFLAALAEGPLPVDEVAALRVTLDPASLADALRRVRGRQGDLAAEVLPLWRRDLSMPPGLEALVEARPVARRAFGLALSGRRGFAEVAALARLLEDPDVTVRQVAGVVLGQTFGDRFAFDPSAPAAARQKVVDAVRRFNRRRGS